MIRDETSDWVIFKELPNNREVDFHFGRRDQYTLYWDRMGEVYNTSLEALEKAYEDGTEYLILTHGHSTSRPGQTTSRSVVRGLMKSPVATPYIIRKKCIQHFSVFVAAIRPKKS